MIYLASVLTRLGARIETFGGVQRLVVPADVRGPVVVVWDASAELHPDGTWTEVLPFLRAVAPEQDPPLHPTSRRSPSPGLQPDLGPLLDCIRARGWQVAGCNDYELGGATVTAWVFSKDGQHVRADGRSDLEVLDLVLDQIREREGDPT